MTFITYKPGHKIVNAFDSHAAEVSGNAGIIHSLTNAIESANSLIRKLTRNRKNSPNEESALKIVYMAIHEASSKWTMPINHWKQALNHFAILYEGRLPELTSK